MAGLADLFATALSQQDEGRYQDWRQRLPGNLSNDGDYDLRGAFLAAAQANGRLHMTDQFKKPNHMSFSDGSQYSTPQHMGGHWSDTGMPNPNTPGEDQFVFWASPYNMQQHGMLPTQRYFDAAEPGNPVVFPLNYNLPRGR